MTTMNDDDLGRLLKKLPRHEASPEFTERLLERLDEPAPRIVPPRWWLAPALGVVVLGSWLAWTVVYERHERRESAARVEALRTEYQELERELEALRDLATDAEPVLELGGTEEVEFVLDLRRLAREREQMRATPTSHSPR